MPPDSGSTFVVIIKVAAALVLFIYLAKIFFWPLLSNLFDLKGKSSDERAAELLTKHHRNTLELDWGTRDISVTSPRLQMLRVGRQGTDVKCLMVNRGGRASNLKIEPVGALRAEVEPALSLENGQTGSISLGDVKTTPDQLQFQLSYDDSLGLRVVRKYAYSKRENKFIEV